MKFIFDGIATWFRKQMNLVRMRVNHPLCFSVRRGDQKKFRRLIADFQHVDPLDASEALTEAALHHRPEMMAMLLGHGVRATVENAEHPYDWWELRLQSIQQLVAAGFVLPTVIGPRCHLLAQALTRGLSEAAQVIRTNDPVMRAELLSEAMVSRWETVASQRDLVMNYLLHGEKPIDGPTEWQPDIGPVHVAVRTDNLELVGRLLAKGASINRKSALGLRPVDEAALYGHLEMVKLLVHNGAQVDHLRWNKPLPWWARAAGHEQVASWLEEWCVERHIQCDPQGDESDLQTGALEPNSSLYSSIPVDWLGAIAPGWAASLSELLAGGVREQAVNLLCLLRPSDQIMTYAGGPPMGFRSGLAVVRDGSVVDRVDLLIS